MNPIDLSDVYSEEYTAEIETYRRFISNFINQIFLKYFVESGLIDQKTQSELVSPNFLPSLTAVNFVKKMLEHYLDAGTIEFSDADKITIKTPIVDTDPGDSQLDKFLAENPSRQNFYQILRDIRDIIGDVLFKGEDALLTLANDNFHKAMELWEDLMVNAEVKKPCHQLVLRTLSEKLRKSKELSIFEGGAGVGAILREAMAVPEIVADIDKIRSYYYTDISLSLIKMGRKWLRENAPSGFPDRTTFKVVDLDKMEIGTEPYTQPESLDMIILEHVLYDVTDLHKTLTLFRQILKPDGILIFTMAYRQSPRYFFPFEFLQSSFQSYNKAKLEPGYRENLGYLTLSEWDASLKRAGFERYDSYPAADESIKWPYGGIVAYPSK